jgi:hypothetical protein
MTNDVKNIIEEIHASPTMAVVAVAGAGSRAIAWLLGVAGASRTVLEVMVPYGRRAMVEFLGHEPAQFVSPATARDMARVGYRRAVRLREGSSPVVGLACTATIATDRPKRGEHRCCVATWDDAGVATYNLPLAKGQRDRDGEEEVVSRLIVQALARVCGLEPELSLGLVEGEKVAVQSKVHPNPIQRLLSEEASTVTVYSDGQMVLDELLPGAAVLPGSFRPLHLGHEQLARVAAQILGTEVTFELSVLNVDKPPLTEGEIRQRLRQFAGLHRVVLTRAATFRQKADLFPGATFILGWDTAVRLVHPRYYGASEQAMLTALAEMWAAGCRFLVAGRQHGDKFHTLEDLPIPQGFAHLFQGIPESRFRMDISSTALRAGGG